MNLPNREPWELAGNDQRSNYGFSSAQGGQASTWPQPFNQRADNAGWYGSGRKSGLGSEATVIPMPGGGTFTLPPMSTEDRWTLNQIRREMFYRKTLPTLAGTWATIYGLNRYVLPQVGKIRIGILPGAGISVFAYLYCTYSASKAAVEKLASSSSSPYAQAIREFLQLRNPNRKFGFDQYAPSVQQPSGSEFSPSQHNSEDLSYYQPVFSEESSKYSQFNKPLSRRLRKVDGFDREFSEDSQFGASSEFAPDDQMSPDMGFRSPRLAPEKDESTVPKTSTSYEELRMKNRGGLKF